ncbi:MAG: ATP-binding protein, partial [Anaerolineae bacterium]
PFYRTEEAKQTAAQGTGLGLSIVKEIITRYNGRVWVESSKGKGSTFSFELPSYSPA